MKRILSLLAMVVFVAGISAPLFAEGAAKEPAAKTEKAEKKAKKGKKAKKAAAAEPEKAAK